MKPNLLALSLTRSDEYLSHIAQVFNASAVLDRHLSPSDYQHKHFVEQLKLSFQSNVLEAYLDNHLSYQPTINIDRYIVKFINDQYLPPDVNTHHFNLNYLSAKAQGSPLPPVLNPIREDYLTWVSQICAWFGVTEFTDNPQQDVIDVLKSKIFFESFIDIRDFVGNDTWKLYGRQTRIGNLFLTKTDDDFRIMHFMRHNLDDYLK